MITAQSSLEAIDYNNLDFIISAIPTQYSKCVQKLKDKVDSKTILVNASKD